MGTSSGANFNQLLPPKVLTPRQHPRLHASLSLASSDARDSKDPASNSDQGNDSPTESASSRDTWPVETAQPNIVPANKNPVDKDKEAESEPLSEQHVIRRVSNADKLSLREVAREGVETISQRMMTTPDEILEELKNELRLILEGSGGSQHQEEFLYLQKLVQRRPDLNAKTLVKAHRVQLEILVAINTGIQAFLHPNVSLPQNHLIEVFTYRRCRNIVCRNTLPADGCSCEVCTNRKGFCNLCMCVICNKFDFEVNTCRWIGCDLCSHWTHTDCAIRIGLVGMGPCVKGGIGSSEMLFRCQACSRTSELLGFVKDVFQHCAPGWDREALLRELDFISRMFRGSEDTRGKKLYWRCEELVEKIRSGASESTACRTLLLFFQELELDSLKSSEGEESGRLIAPQEACNRIAEVVQEAVRKMEIVAEEKMRMLKRSGLALEACERELEDKTREVTELNMERQRKKQQVDELESIVRLKRAEADMFQLKANEARQEAERLKGIALTKSDNAEHDYASRYLKRRLDEAEAEKQFLYEKIKLQESQRAQQGSSSAGGDTSPMLMLSRIQDLLMNVYSTPHKEENQQSTDHTLGM